MISLKSEFAFSSEITLEIPPLFAFFNSISNSFVALLIVFTVLFTPLTSILSNKFFVLYIKTPDTRTVTVAAVFKIILDISFALLMIYTPS